MADLRRKIPVIFILFTLLQVGCSLDYNGPSGYALIYGVSEYTIAPDLRFTDDDARSMAELFEAAGYSVTLRLNGDATKEQFLLDIDIIAAEIGESENFVFYFSGHGGRHVDFYGTYSDQGGSESESSDSDDEWIFLSGSLISWYFDDWPETAVSDDELGELLDILPTDRRIVLIDACNSGGFIGDSPVIDATPSDYSDGEQDITFRSIFDLYTSFASGESFDVTSNQAIVLAAAGEREESWENSGIEHGIFTYYFIEARDYADVDGNGFITILELYSYVCDKIDVEWNEAEGEPYVFMPRITGTPMDYVLFKTQI